MEYVLGEFTDRSGVLDLMYLIDLLDIRDSTFTSMGGLFSHNVESLDIRALSTKLKDTNNDMSCIRGPYDKQEYFGGKEVRWVTEGIQTIPDYYNYDGMFVYGGDPAQDKFNIDINWLMTISPNSTVEYFLPTFPQRLGEIFPELYDGNVTYGDFNPYENAQSKLDYIFDSIQDDSRKTIFFRHNNKFYYRKIGGNHYVGIPPNIIIATAFIYEATHVL